MSRFGTFSVESYGQLPGGEVVWLVRLRADSGLQAEVLTLGATLHGLNVPTDAAAFSEKVKEYLAPISDAIYNR